MSTAPAATWIRVQSKLQGQQTFIRASSIVKVVQGKGMHIELSTERGYDDPYIWAGETSADFARLMQALGIGDPA